MAFATAQGTIAQNSLRARFETFLEGRREALVKRRVYRKTLNELQSLNSRDLADLGIARSQIQSIAYEAAYGA